MATATRVTKLSVPDVETNGHANNLSGLTPSQVIMGVQIEGVSRMLFHRYDCESVEVKAKAAKGSAAKKTDDINSYVYRDTDGNLCVPADAIQGTIIASAKSFQDPRSPRKSAMDIVKAAVLVLPDMVPLRKPNGEIYREWDFTDTRRVQVQRGTAISRTRPGVEAGWQADFQIVLLLPELITPDLTRSILANAGAVCGLCDYRPRFGRFCVTRIQTLTLG